MWAFRCVDPFRSTLNERSQRSHLTQPHTRLGAFSAPTLTHLILTLTTYSARFSPKRVRVVSPSRRPIVDGEQEKDKEPEVATSASSGTSEGIWRGEVEDVITNISLGGICCCTACMFYLYSMQR